MYTPPEPELIFLGPDENVTPNDIEWIVERARARRYAMPSAFMSSKPKAGINHKASQRPCNPAACTLQSFKLLSTLQ